MRKNIFTLFAFAVTGSCFITACAKKAVVTPKPTNSSAITLKTGTTTGSTTTTQTGSSGTHTCGGGQHDGGDINYHPGG